MHGSVPDKRRVSATHRQQQSQVATDGNERSLDKSGSWKTTTPPGRTCMARFRGVALEDEDAVANDSVKGPREWKVMSPAPLPTSSTRIPDADPDLSTESSGDRIDRCACTARRSNS